MGRLGGAPPDSDDVTRDVCYALLQIGGPPKALQQLLGLVESMSIKRYLDAAGVARKTSHRVRNHAQI